MAKQRYINTKFWSDTWVREKLNALDRYLFLYLLTNEHTNISGIYELPISLLAFESGIDKEELEKTMFPHLSPKVYYEKSWVIIINFPHHQDVDNPKIMAGIQAELEKVPPIIYEKAIGYGYPIHRESHLIKLNIIPSEISKNEISGGSVLNEPTYDSALEQPDDGNVRKKKDTFNKRYMEIVLWAQRRRSELEGKPFIFPDSRSEFAALKKLREASFSMEKIKERWIELAADPPKDGFNFHTVLWSLSKKP